MGPPARRWSLALLPALAGLAGAWVLRRESIPDPLLELQTAFHAGTLVMAGGVVVTLALLEGLLIWHVAQDRLDRALQTRRRMAAEARRRFIRRLDHELKNPLTASYAALDNLAAARTTEERQQALGDVTSQLKRTEGLMRALRKLSDLEGRPIEMLPVDVVQLLRDALDGIEGNSDVPRRCRLTSTVAGRELVQGDRDLLWMMFFNLLDNALKFSSPEEPVAVGVSTAEACVRVTVRDQGQGIAETDVAHVFEELYRGDNAAGVEGSGIGLALARTVAERHGGALEVASKLGQGSTFTVVLPTLHAPDS